MSFCFFSESGNSNFWWILKFYGLELWKKSTVLDGLFPYLAQMITGMRGCVAYNDLWPWPISSRSFGLGPENRWPISSRSFGLGPENRVRSVSSTVLDGFFPYWVQMITSMRRCVACDDLWLWHIFKVIRLDFDNHVRPATFWAVDWFFPYLPQIFTTIRGCELVKFIIKF